MNPVDEATYIVMDELMEKFRAEAPAWGFTQFIPGKTGLLYYHTARDGMVYKITIEPSPALADFRLRNEDT